MCNLHWCYTFCTGVTLFALVLHLNCTALSQSESSNFFMCIIKKQITPLLLLHNYRCVAILSSGEVGLLGGLVFASTVGRKRVLVFHQYITGLLPGLGGSVFAVPPLLLLIHCVFPRKSRASCSKHGLR